MSWNKDEVCRICAQYAPLVLLVNNANKRNFCDPWQWRECGIIFFHILIWFDRQVGGMEEAYSVDS